MRFDQSLWVNVDIGREQFQFLIFSFLLTQQKITKKVGFSLWVS